MTLTELRELSNTKLANESEITAAEHREVNNAIFDFLETMLPLAEGSFHIGDVTSTDNIRTVSFDDVGTADYKVFGMPVSNSVTHSVDNDVILMVREKTRTSFKISLREVAPETQDLNFDWMIKRNN